MTDDVTRDWRAEQAALLADVAAASEILKSVEMAVEIARSDAARSVARYVAEDAREALQRKVAELAAFEDERSACQRSRREP